MSSFGERLKELRKENNITQENLAKKINVSTRLINYYENNDKKPSVEKIHSICKIFNISADYLLGFSNKKRPLNNK